MLLYKLSSVCVGYWERMWVGFSLVAKFPILAVFGHCLSEGFLRCLVFANLG